jgi:putative transposase
MSGLKKRLSFLLIDRPPRELINKLIDWNGKLSLARQASLLNISRSSLYYHPKPVDSFELEIMNKIDEIYTQKPFYGSPRITWELNQTFDAPINHKRVERLMRVMGLQAVCPKRNLSKRSKPHKIYPYLLKGIKITESNQVWGADITYIRLLGGYIYLMAILDWFSRYIVAFKISTGLDKEFCLEASNEALSKYQPGIINTDQGVQFTCKEWINLYEENDVQISMDGRGRALDNVFTERIWRTIKYEEVYLKQYQSVNEAIENLSSYIKYYNYQRPHSSLKYKTPANTFFNN